MRLHHVAIITADYPRAKAFYSEQLGFSILAEHYRTARNSWKCDLGINGHYLLELFSFPNPPERPSQPEACGARHIAFAVANIADKREELLAKAIECEEIRIDEYTGKPFFFIHDPDGLPLEFYEE